MNQILTNLIYPPPLSYPPTLFLGVLILERPIGLVVGRVSLSISSSIFSSDMMGSGWFTSIGLHKVVSI
jgi:hypothetical protein